MKSHFLTRWTLGLLLAGLPWVGGCSQNSTNPPAQDHSDKSATNAAPPAATNTSAVVAPIAVDPDTVKPVVPDKDADKPLPENIAVSPPLAEVVKMAQAGVDESIMLPFVKNATNPFELGSEQIIYLNDLGVPSEVITAMIQHDQSLGATTAPISAPTEVAVSSPPQQPVYAPAYENPPAIAQPDQEAPGYAPGPEEQPVVNSNYFYDSLSPYGSWINVGGYGWCWQPTVTVIHSGWRPYCDGGRWLYSSSGWYWQSDYSWGGIAFHYGRWFCDPQWGWCWWPNTVWSPAWVTWRYNSGYCGWAPLPPYASCASGVGITYYGGAVNASFGFGLNAGCYAFVPWQNFCNYRPYRYCAPRATANQIYDQSVVVNNFVQANNTTVINRGIPVDKVAALSKSEIRKVAIRDLPSGAMRPSPGDRPQREGGQMVVYRSGLPVAPTDRPSPSAWTPAPLRGAVSSTGKPGAASVHNIGGAKSKPTAVDSSVSTFNGRTIRSAYTPASVAATRPGFAESPDTATANAPQVIGGAPSSASAPSAPTAASSTAWPNGSNPLPGARNNYIPREKAPPGSIILVGDGSDGERVRQPLQPRNTAPAAGNQSAANSVSQSTPAAQPAYWQHTKPAAVASHSSVGASAPAQQSQTQVVIPTHNRPNRAAQIQQNDPSPVRSNFQPSPRAAAQPVNSTAGAVQSAPAAASVQAGAFQPATAPSPAPTRTVTSTRSASSTTTQSDSLTVPRARGK